MQERNSGENFYYLMKFVFSQKRETDYSTFIEHIVHARIKLTEINKKIIELEVKQIELVFKERFP